MSWILLRESARHLKKLPESLNQEQQDRCWANCFNNQAPTKETPLGSFPFKANPPIPSINASSALNVGVAMEGVPADSFVGVGGWEELREAGRRGSEEGAGRSTSRRSTEFEKQEPRERK